MISESAAAVTTPTAQIERNIYAVGRKRWHHIRI